jgi:hypothetical protein
VAKKKSGVIYSVLSQYEKKWQLNQNQYLGVI